MIRALPGVRIFSGLTAPVNFSRGEFVTEAEVVQFSYGIAVPISLFLLLFSFELSAVCGESVQWECY